MSRGQVQDGLRLVALDQTRAYSRDTSAYLRDDPESVHVRIPPGSHPVIREFFGRSQATGPGPQGYLVEVFPANSTAGAHFHPVDQFQIFFGSSGAWYQRHEIPEGVVVVHYTDAYSTYGPFGTKEEDFAFYTLRAAASTVTAYMPGSRDQLIHHGQRNIEVALSTEGLERPAGGLVERTVLIEPHADGLAAVLVQAGPDAELTIPAPQPGSPGEYLCVLAGEIHRGGERFRPRSLGWWDGTGSEQRVRAGADGVDVVLMQFPVPTVDESLDRAAAN